MNIQVRIRTDESFASIGYIKDWLNAAPKGFAFEHNKHGNHHYHVYLFGLERNPDAMRRHLGKHLSDKELYAVGTTCGGKKKIKITEEGAYQYGTTNLALEPVWSKGYSLDTLQLYHKNAIDFYKPVEVVLITKEEHYVVKPDRVWERLHAKADEYVNMSVRAIKSKLAAEWLNNGKAIPRTADLHRYALSLHYLNKYEKGAVPETALEEEYI